MTKHIWWLTYANKSEKRANGTVVKLAMIKNGLKSWLTIATSHNEHINHTSFRVHTYSPTTDEAKRKEDNPTARSLIVPTGLTTDQHETKHSNDQGLR